MHLKIGQEVDGYLIQEVIGQGGMGIVYRAEDVGLSRQVALKVITPSMSGDDMFVHRFRSEARTLARVNSPHIVLIHAFRKTEHGFFIVMEYVDGGDLSDLIAKGPMSLDEALPLMKQLLRAFRDAHKAGVVHRDIKPPNIMITRSGDVKVTDFGLAKLNKPEVTKTMTDGVMGSINYMSPEQVRADDVDHRSDIWSLGVVMYEMLVGRRPFETEREASTLYAIMNNPVEKPRAGTGELPDELWKIIEQALEKDPDERYADASRMLTDLESFEQRFISGADPRDAPTAADTTRLVTDRPEEAQVSGQTDGVATGRLGLIAAAIVLAVIAIASIGYLWATGGSETAEGLVISLDTDPTGAVVYVAGDSVGTTPIEALELAPGEDSASVRIRREGYAQVDTMLAAGEFAFIPLRAEEARASTAEADGQTVEPRQENQTPGGRTTESESATESAGQALQPGRLSLRAIPAAEVFVNGRSVSTSELRVPSGQTHEITFRSTRSGSATTSVRLAPGERREITAWFTARINISSGSVNGASVRLNGDYIEETPVIGKVVETGEYVIELEKVGYIAHPADTTIVIEPSFGEQRTIPVRFTLIPE